MVGGGDHFYLKF